ncbi:MAG: hypothetical protein QW279_00730 [Candidatus Jordarchaeaceae archaeon]
MLENENFVINYLIRIFKKAGFAISPIQMIKTPGMEEVVNKLRDQSDLAKIITCMPSLYVHPRTKKREKNEPFFVSIVFGKSRKFFTSIYEKYFPTDQLFFLVIDKKASPQIYSFEHLRNKKSGQPLRKYFEKMSLPNTFWKIYNEFEDQIKTLVN